MAEGQPGEHAEPARVSRLATAASQVSVNPPGEAKAAAPARQTAAVPPLPGPARARSNRISSGEERNSSKSCGF